MGQPASFNHCPHHRHSHSHSRSHSHSHSHSRGHHHGHRGPARSIERRLDKLTSQIQKLLPTEAELAAQEAAALEAQTPIDPATIVVDPTTNRYPFCIVWAPIPFVTWFIPLIGHLGIANSQGLIYDFSDDFTVSVDKFSHGPPTKYYQLEVERFLLTGTTARDYDRAVEELGDFYSRTRHSLCYNNCQEYISGILNRIQYDNQASWSQSAVFSMITLRSSYVSCWGFMRQWAVFLGLMISLIVTTVMLATLLGGSEDY